MPAFFSFILARATGPRRIATATSKRLEYRWGGDAGAILVGLPVLCAGLFVFWALIFRGMPKWVREPPTGWEWGVLALAFLSTVLVGLMFAVAGALFVFVRRGAILDKDSRTMTLWWSLPFVKRSTVHSLRDVTGVRIQRTGGSARAGPTFSVLLASSSGAEHEVAVAAISREKAEAVAKEVADFLEVRPVTVPE